MPEKMIIELIFEHAGPSVIGLEALDFRIFAYLAVTVNLPLRCRCGPKSMFNIFCKSNFTHHKWKGNW